MANEHSATTTGVRRSSNWWHRLNWRVKVTIVLTTVILGPILYLELPWEQAYREGAVRVMRAELDRLPSVGDEAELSLLQYPSFSSPNVSASYPQAVSCNTVQDHYQQVAGQVGWVAGGGEIIEPQLERGYHKVAGGYYLTLIIECTQGTETSSLISAVYGVFLNVPFPQSVAIIGPWRPN
jgi:hypothetical protein